METLALSHEDGAALSSSTAYEVHVHNRFQMGKMIGSGSFGEIYLGIDMKTGKEVAVKFE